MSFDLSHRRTAATAPMPAALSERLRFDGDNRFQRELRRRVQAQFKHSGMRQRDSTAMYLKTTVILAAFAASYVALVCFARNGWLRWQSA